MKKKIKEDIIKQTVKTILMREEDFVSLPPDLAVLVRNELMRVYII
jgi:hypothetical protein